MTELISGNTELTPEQLAEADAEVAWRNTLPEALRPVAARYGKHRFAIAFNIGAAQESLKNIASQVARHEMLMFAVQHAASAANQLSFYAMESQDMTGEDLRTIQRDIEYAVQLSAASRATPGGKIIIPS